ncbi:hypothetical protein HAX54_024661 [Datura stramonium]|uniref:F-box associated beta-propeller type 1 domain-containing protein n=1 Tax=Datura stramonium TaxID=4076 RepID=A0ABS8RGX6_DATST|nr:hypothetical protein [Datura stramonium]
MVAKGKGNGKRTGKGKGKGGNSKKTKSKPPDPTSHCIFPREIIFNILSRLPPTDSPILIHTRHVKSADHVLSLFDPPESSVVELDNPFPFFFHEMAVVGSCNGIVCLCKPPWGDMITLWNPAMRQSRAVQLSKKKPLMGVHSGVSIGLAYDSLENDFFILSLLCFRLGPRVPDEVEMCSTKSFRWKQLKNEVGFRVLGPSCNVIIKGVPYWSALVEDEYGLREVLVYFDVGRKVFEKLPMPGITVGTRGILWIWRILLDSEVVGSISTITITYSAGINLKVISGDDPRQVDLVETFLAAPFLLTSEMALKTF